MVLHASAWLPWIFFGPLLVAVGNGLAYQLTRVSLFATLAQVAMALTLIVGVLAFVAARRVQKPPRPPEA